MLTATASAIPVLAGYRGGFLGSAVSISYTNMSMMKAEVPWWFFLGMKSSNLLCSSLWWPQ
jgi:hypothetical protein